MSALRDLQDCALKDRLAIARRRHALNSHLAGLPEMEEACERAARELRELMREAKRRKLDQPPAAASLSCARPTKTVNRFPPRALPVSAPKLQAAEPDRLAVIWQAAKIASKGSERAFRTLFADLARDVLQPKLPGVDPSA